MTVLDLLAIDEAPVLQEAQLEGEFAALTYNDGLLYTSDDADDRLWVGLGGRRIILYTINYIYNQ